jgi:ADP-ribose pyrophosphatase
MSKKALSQLERVPYVYAQDPPVEVSGMSNPPLELLSSERVYEGRLFSVDVEQVRLPSGRTGKREIVRHPGAVVLVIVDNEEKLLMVRQYRRAADRYLLELPAGTRDKEESAEECARREAEEETGFSVARVERIGGFYSAPGFCTEYLECFLCTGLGGTELKPEEDEDLELVRLSIEELQQAFARGEVEDAKTLAGVMLYMARQGV